MSLSDDVTTREISANKNVAFGYPGLSATRALQLINTAGSFTSVLQNAATVARTWTMKDADGTVAFMTDITGGTSAGSFTTLTASGAIVGTTAGVRLPTASPIYFNAGFTSYIQEVAAGNISVVAGGTTVSNFTATGLTVSGVVVSTGGNASFGTTNQANGRLSAQAGSGASGYSAFFNNLDGIYFFFEF